LIASVHGFDRSRWRDCLKSSQFPHSGDRHQTIANLTNPTRARH
jgi:hypothetical protein